MSVHIIPGRWVRVSVRVGVRVRVRVRVRVKLLLTAFTCSHGRVQRLTK